MQRIGLVHFERIVKNRNRLAEVEAMFGKVRDCLGGVPFEFHFSIVLQSTMDGQFVQDERLAGLSADIKPIAELQLQSPLLLQQARF